MTSFLDTHITLLLQIAGYGQIILIIGSLGIPTVLDWKNKLSSVSTLIRQMFWVYSLYIWCTNLCFGLISAFGAHLLVDQSPLATCVSGFIFGYWLLRIFIQWLYFDISELPKGIPHKIARWLLEILFLGLTFIYGYTFIHNIQPLIGHVS